MPHFVAPSLDIRFAQWSDKSFNAVDMQLHTEARMRQDPNAGLEAVPPEPKRVPVDELDL